MDIYLIISIAVIVCLLILSIIMFINIFKYKKEIEKRNEDLKILNSKVKLLGKQLLIKDATLHTCMSNVDSLKLENNKLKNQILNNKKKIDAINNFIGEIKKT